MVRGSGLGLVPRGWARRSSGRRSPPSPRPLPDVGEADRELRAALLDSANRLAALDVARWRPEVADELIDLRHPRPVPRRRHPRPLPRPGRARPAGDDDRRPRPRRRRRRPERARDRAAPRRAGPARPRRPAGAGRRVLPRGVAARLTGRPGQAGGRWTTRTAFVVRVARPLPHVLVPLQAARLDHAAGEDDGVARRVVRQSERLPRREDVPARSCSHWSPSQCHTSPDARSRSEPPTIRMPSWGWAIAWALTTGRGRSVDARAQDRPSHTQVSPSAGRQLEVDDLVPAVEDQRLRAGSATIAAGHRIGSGPGGQPVHWRPSQAQVSPCTLPPVLAAAVQQAGPDAGSKAIDAANSAPGPVRRTRPAAPSHSQVSSEAPAAVSPAEEDDHVAAVVVRGREVAARGRSRPGRLDRRSRPRRPSATAPTGRRRPSFRAAR